ncbi:MAG TPA: metalloregulator ArsR/SmtB family transcription factor [Lachnospiraceae bacterium]|nr:metalloregulator ArsR/SmtB family transcription factor [Lachnospiraceae bacterium]
MVKMENVCDCNIINEEVVVAVREQMLSAEIYDKIAGFFKLVGDPTRCEIIAALAISEMCVGDLANVLTMTKSSISHQLGKMKENGVVKSRRDGKEVYYSLDDDHVASIFQLTVEHMRHLNYVNN